MFPSNFALNISIKVFINVSVYVLIKMIKEMFIGGVFPLKHCI